MQQKKFSIHFYPQVRVKVSGVTAESGMQAIEKAEAAINFHEVCDRRFGTMLDDQMRLEEVEWTESAHECVLIDPILEDGEVDYDASVYVDGAGNTLIDGLTTQEREAQAAKKAALFMQELLASVETLSGLADEHGQQTLVDLFYLHSAIVTNGFIDVFSDHSAVSKVVSALPSAEVWLGYVRSNG